MGTGAGARRCSTRRKDFALTAGLYMSPMQADPPVSGAPGGAATSIASLGTGVLGHDLAVDSHDSKQTRMSAPSDLAVSNDKLYIAVSGQHQIWQFDLARKQTQCTCLAGNGRLGIGDGDGIDASHQPDPAAFGAVRPNNCSWSTRRVRPCASSTWPGCRVNFDDRSGPYDFGDAAGIARRDCKSPGHLRRSARPCVRRRQLQLQDQGR